MPAEGTGAQCAGRPTSPPHQATSARAPTSPPHQATSFVAPTSPPHQAASFLAPGWNPLPVSAQTAAPTFPLSTITAPAAAGITPGVNAAVAPAATWTLPSAGDLAVWFYLLPLVVLLLTLDWSGASNGATYYCSGVHGALGKGLWFRTVWSGEGHGSTYSIEPLPGQDMRPYMTPKQAREAREEEAASG